MVQTKLPEKQVQDDEMLIDTSKMSEGQRQTLEVAEAARDKGSMQPSFARQLFMGTFAPAMLHPFPQQSQREREEGDLLIAKVTECLKKHVDPDEVDETRTIPAKAIEEMAKLGLFAMKVPKQYGGLGLSQVNYNRIMMYVSSYCASTAVLLSAHQSIGVPEPLKLFGTDEQKKKFFPRFREGAISAFALTEPGVGSDPAQMTTDAVLSPDGKHYILNGLKLWCTNGPIADILVVMSKTPSKIVKGKERKQITAFIVESKTPGIEVVHRCDFMGLRGIQNGLLKFTNVKVPVENMLWGEGRGLALALKTLNTGRLTIPAACTGIAKQCLSIARRWGNERVQWGVPVGLHESGREKISFIAATTLAMEAITWISSHWADQGEFDIRIEAAMAKLFCSEASWQVIDKTLQLRGGRGYERATSLRGRGEVPYPVERMMRDARINTIIEGTSEIMRLFLAREALDPHLNLAADLLKSSVPMMGKAKAALKLIGFYGSWYPRQWIMPMTRTSHSGMGPLAKHYRFAEKTGHRLARSLFHAMAKYRERLEKKQIVLGHIVDIGTELFAMTATCAYATMLVERRPDDQTPIALAEHFCNMAQQRIQDHFAALSRNDQGQSNQLAKKVLEGATRWQEEGIIWIGPQG